MHSLPVEVTASTATAALAAVRGVAVWPRRAEQSIRCPGLYRQPGRGEDGRGKYRPSDDDGVFASDSGTGIACHPLLFLCRSRSLMSRSPRSHFPPYGWVVRRAPFAR